LIETLHGKAELPGGLPSRASLAAMVLRQLKDDRDEISAAIDDLEKAIWQEGS
jgi:hypothetical protein